MYKRQVLSKLDNIVFFSEMPKDGSSYIKILGLDGSKRTEKWIRKDYVRVPENFGSYKVFISKANGSGAVSYTHLDVYKRQVLSSFKFSNMDILARRETTANK